MPQNELELFVHQDGLWFRLGDGPCVDLSSRSKYRALLLLLVRERKHPNQARLSVADLVRELWPEERLRLDVARNRVYVALCTLRKWGLQDVMERSGEGYRISPRCTVIMCDRPLPTVAFSHAG